MARPDICKLNKKCHGCAATSRKYFINKKSGDGKSSHGVCCEANKNGFEKIQDYKKSCEGFEPLIN